MMVTSMGAMPTLRTDIVCAGLFPLYLIPLCDSVLAPGRHVAEYHQQCEGLRRHPHHRRAREDPLRQYRSTSAHLLRAANDTIMTSRREHVAK